jgi:hypothetical protein
MPSIKQQLGLARSAWEDDTSPASPGAEFGLAFDPTAYLADLFGKGDNYRRMISKSGREMNRTLSSAIGTDDRGGWVANKPVSTVGMLVGGYYGGSGLAGMGGGGAGGGASGGGQGLGLFANGGQGGMAGVGGGNAGALAQAGGIPGGAGIGSATAGGGMGQMGMQDWMKLAQSGGGGGMGGAGGGNQQQAPPPPQAPGGVPAFDPSSVQMAGKPTFRKESLASKAMAGLGNLRDGLTPMDPRMAEGMDPNYVKQLRNQAMLKMGLGMMSAAQGGARFGQALGAGIGQAQHGFGRDIEQGYQVSKEQRAEKRQTERTAIEDQRYTDEWGYNVDRDTKLDARHDKERGEDILDRQQQRAIDQQRADAYASRLERMQGSYMKIADIDRLRRERNDISEKQRERTMASDTLLMQVPLAQSGNAQAQLAMVSAFQRMMEPGSVTMPAEAKVITQARGIFESASNYIEQLKQGTPMPPEQVERMARVAKLMKASAADARNEIDSYYSELATKRGIDPFDIVGGLSAGGRTPGGPGSSIDVGAALGGSAPAGLGAPQKRTVGYGAGTVQVDY